jgi:hypothetical protein
MAAVQGAFYGANLPAARLEGLIAAHVPKKHILDVARSYGTKWWDYRRLTPGHSFFLFAHHYYKALKVSARQSLWHRTQRGQNGAGVGILGVNSIHFTVDTIWERERKHITGMWTAMTVADAAGIPYDQYCRLANQTALDTLWKRLPTPAQLYSDKLGAAILSKWEGMIGNRLILATHPLYAAENYAGLPVQDAYHDWLVERVRERVDPAPALANCVYRTPQLPEAIALKEFPQPTIVRARLMAN